MEQNGLKRLWQLRREGVHVPARIWAGVALARVIIVLCTIMLQTLPLLFFGLFALVVWAVQ